ncbi:hypothetical protein [Nocardia rosealba]|uniref:hypothetical protein n=1 Tax=Nocardia rosealba TaxID=2878563 RepID=UPI001CDA052C|nr:hypothetical protein [Nocardia rosealba]MCA2207389.1 hypothetical protein [Nocardia rosealba]
MQQLTNIGRTDLIPEFFRRFRHRYGPMTDTLETDVLALLQPGGMLTADTIAHNLNAPKWRVVRVLNTLRDKGDAFRNQRGEWQISAGKRRPERQVIR